MRKILAFLAFLTPAVAFAQPGQYVPPPDGISIVLNPSGQLSATGAITTSCAAGPATSGGFAIGTLGYSDTNICASLVANTNSYIQAIIQNKSAGSTASAGWLVNNNLSTVSTYYGEFGMNSSGFAGTGSLNLPNAVYLTGTSGDLSIGTTTSNAIHFVTNNSGTDAATISPAGVLSLGTPLPIASGGGGSYGMLNPATGTATAVGSGYVNNDTITLSVAGCTTNPVVYAYSTTGGGISLWGVQNPGVCPSVPASGTVVSQAATSGIGTGFQLTVGTNLFFGTLSAGLPGQWLGYSGANLFLGGIGTELSGSNFTGGAENVCIGPWSCLGLKQGSYNTAVGMHSMGRGTTTTAAGIANTAIGDDAMRNWGSTSNVTAIGSNALRNVASTGSGGYAVTGIGSNVGTTVTTGANLFLGGYNVGSTTLASGSNGILIGVSGEDTATSSSTNFVAVGVGVKPGTGDVAFGVGALASSTGDSNVNAAGGYYALHSNTSGVRNSAWGYLAGQSNTTGSNNWFGGSQAGQANTTGNLNTYTGWQTGYSSTASGYNTGYGAQALYNWIGPGAGNQGYMAAFGTNACNGAASASGDHDTCIGGNSLQNMTSAYKITAVGYNSGSHVTSGQTSVYIGTDVASVTQATGTGNVLIGVNSSCDTAAAGTSNYLALCGSGGAAVSVSGANTPSTSTTAVAGNLTVSGTSTVGGVAQSPYAQAAAFCSGSYGAVSLSSGTLSLTYDLCATNITLSGTGKLQTNGFRVFWTGTMDISAAGANAIVGSSPTAGGNGSGSTGGASGSFSGFVNYSCLPIGVTPLGTAGGAGQTGAGTASGAPGLYGGISPTQLSGPSGVGGSGGAGSSGSGGTAGAVSTPTYSSPRFVNATPLQGCGVFGNNGGNGSSNPMYIVNAAPSGGGGGGGDGTNSGGGGGGAGISPMGVVLIGNTIAMGTNSTAGIISNVGSNGGNGANGTGGNAAGGGGGGGAPGSFVYVQYVSLTGSANGSAINVSGGSGGNGGNGSGTGKGGNGAGGGGGGLCQTNKLAGPAFSTSTFQTAGTAGSTTSTSTGASGGAGASVTCGLS